MLSNFGTRLIFPPDNFFDIIFSRYKNNDKVILSQR
jgi:hypothetical protein